MHSTQQACNEHLRMENDSIRILSDIFCLRERKDNSQSLPILDCIFSAVVFHASFLHSPNPKSLKAEFRKAGLDKLGNASLRMPEEICLKMKL